jgi:hypothetical protein
VAVCIDFISFKNFSVFSLSSKGSGMSKKALENIESGLNKLDSVIKQIT